MRKFGAGLMLLMITGIFSAVSRAEEAPPRHYYNAAENLNPDPAYIPGDFAQADKFAARNAYYQTKATLVEGFTGAEAVTLGTGEVTFKIAKNETASVLGYFREYLGVLTLGAAGPERMEMILNINSLETGVPGRNGRILDLFFESMKPELGTADVVFDQFEVPGVWESWALGETRSVAASGNLTLDGVTRPVSARLSVIRQGTSWKVESEAPLMLNPSDFEFGNRIYDLMKSCNHKSIGNAVEIKVKLELR